MKKILIAIDGSENAMRAVEYAGFQFAGTSDLKITLLHVLPYVPTSFWDDGHILTEQEREERRNIVGNWIEGRKLKIEPVFRAAMDVLVSRGIMQEQIEEKTILDSLDVAESILEEASDGDYQTIILGRRGLSRAMQFLMGSVTNKVVGHGAGTAICIVE